MVDINSVLLLEHKKWENDELYDEIDDFSEKIKEKVCYNIYLETMHPLEKEFINKMDKEIVWQENAKKIIANVIKNAILWIRPKRWPLWVLFFTWPTWVWKTEIVKCISEVLMWDKNLFQKINCESYQESHTKRQLFWAPPSYVWYGDPTPLNPKIINWYYKKAKENDTIHDSIKHIPNFSIILFDEFEKAHKDIAQSLLSLLDEWEITFWDGKKWNFKNSIIIFTSNIWQDEIEKFKEKKTIWFIYTEVDNK